MLRRLGRLFVIKTRWEAFAVIYALALGAVERGFHYVDSYPGVGGWLLFAACTGVVFMAGATLLDHTRRDTSERRRGTDAVPQADRNPAVRPAPANDRHSPSPDHDEGIAGGSRAGTWMFSGATGRSHHGILDLHTPDSPAATTPPGLAAQLAGRTGSVIPPTKKAMLGSTIGPDGEQAATRRDNGERRRRTDAVPQI